VTASNNTGVWGTGSNGVLHLLLRTGQSITANNQARIVGSFTVPALVSSAPTAGHAGLAGGVVPVLVTFKDKTQAIVRVDIP
jgi:hypothetical protein